MPNILRLLKLLWLPIILMHLSSCTTKLEAESSNVVPGSLPYFPQNGTSSNRATATDATIMRSTVPFKRLTGYYASSTGESTTLDSYDINNGDQSFVQRRLPFYRNGLDYMLATVYNYSTKTIQNADKIKVGLMSYGAIADSTDSKFVGQTYTSSTNTFTNFIGLKRDSNINIYNCLTTNSVCENRVSTTQNTQDIANIGKIGYNARGVDDKFSYREFGTTYAQLISGLFYGQEVSTSNGIVSAKFSPDALSGYAPLSYVYAYNIDKSPDADKSMTGQLYDTKTTPVSTMAKALANMTLNNIQIAVYAYGTSFRRAGAFTSPYWQKAENMSKDSTGFYLTGSNTGSGIPRVTSGETYAGIKFYATGSNSLNTGGYSQSSYRYGISDTPKTPPYTILTTDTKTLTPMNTSNYVPTSTAATKLYFDTGSSSFTTTKSSYTTEWDVNKYEDFYIRDEKLYDIASYVASYVAKQGDMNSLILPLGQETQFNATFGVANNVKKYIGYNYYSTQGNSTWKAGLPWESGFMYGDIFRYVGYSKGTYYQNAILFANGATVTNDSSISFNKSTQSNYSNTKYVVNGVTYYANINYTLPSSFYGDSPVGMVPGFLGSSTITMPISKSIAGINFSSYSKDGNNNVTSAKVETIESTWLYDQQSIATSQLGAMMANVKLILRTELGGDVKGYVLANYLKGMTNPIMGTKNPTFVTANNSSVSTDIAYTGSNGFNVDNTGNSTILADVSSGDVKSLYIASNPTTLRFLIGTGGGYKGLDYYQNVLGYHAANDILNSNTSQNYYTYSGSDPYLSKGTATSIGNMTLKQAIDTIGDAGNLDSTGWASLLAQRLNSLGFAFNSNFSDPQNTSVKSAYTYQNSRFVNNLKTIGYTMGLNDAKSGIGGLKAYSEIGLKFTGDSVYSPSNDLSFIELNKFITSQDSVVLSSGSVIKDIDGNELTSVQYNYDALTNVKQLGNVLAVNGVYIGKEVQVPDPEGLISGNVTKIVNRFIGVRGETGYMAIYACYHGISDRTCLDGYWALLYSRIPSNVFGMGIFDASKNFSSYISKSGSVLQWTPTQTGLSLSSAFGDSITNSSSVAANFLGNMSFAYTTAAGAMEPLPVDLRNKISFQTGSFSNFISDSISFISNSSGGSTKSYSGLNMFGFGKLSFNSLSVDGGQTAFANKFNLNDFETKNLVKVVKGNLSNVAEESISYNLNSNLRNVDLFGYFNDFQSTQNTASNQVSNTTFVASLTENIKASIVSSGFSPQSISLFTNDKDISNFLISQPTQGNGSVAQSSIGARSSYSNLVFNAGDIRGASMAFNVGNFSIGGYSVRGNKNMQTQAIDIPVLSSENTLSGIQGIYDYKSINTKLFGDISTLNESSSILGSQGSSALLFGGQGSRTNYATIGFVKSIPNQKIKFLGQGTYGLTSINENNNTGLITNVSNLSTSSFSLGLSYEPIKDDSLNFTISQPIRVERGTASISNGDGKSANFSLSPFGRQINYELSYTRQNQGGFTSLSTYYITEYGNIQNADSHLLLVIKTGKKF